MKKLLLLLALITGNFLYGQVGIGTDLPNPSTQLEIKSSNRGVLIPQVPLTSITDQTTISAGNLESLLVYNTSSNETLTPGYYYWYQGTWNKLMVDNDLPDNIVFYDNITNEFTYTDINGDVQNIKINELVESLTFLGLNADGKTLQYTDENNVVTNINLETVIKNFETLTTIVANNDGTFTYTDEKGNETIINLAAGPAGADGKSAYEIWEELPGNDGKTETEYIASLKGDAGADGTSITQGSGMSSAPTNPKHNDSYIDITTNNIYEYDNTSSTWNLTGNIKGDAGEKGTSITQGSGMSSAPTTPKHNDTYIDITTNNIYEYDNTTSTWNLTGNIKGDDGKSAYEIWESLPGNDGKTETEYIASLKGDAGANGIDGKSAYEVWEGLPGNNGKTEAEYIASLKGDTGADGTNGISITQGAGTPTANPPANPQNGDTYINVTTGDVYEYDGTDWNLTGSVKGNAGTDGKSAYEVWEGLPGNNGKTEAEYIASLKGDTGADGTNGTSITQGAGTPTANPPANPQNGDTYINVTTGDIYEYDGTNWNQTGSIKGEKGDDGNTVLNGTAAPVAADGNNGDFFLDTATNTLYGPKTAAGWGAGVSLKGDDGADGNTVLNGTAVPVAADGNNGDFFLNTATNTLYGPKTAAGWGAGVSLKGDDGVDGNTVLNGTAAPVAADGTDGDFFLNTVTNTLYGPKTATGWGTGVSLKGDDGKSITQGAGDPATNGPANPQDGDTYIDTTTNNIYEYDNSTSVWNQTGNIKGEQGPQGPSGVTGPVSTANLTAGDPSVIVTDGTNATLENTNIKVADNGITTAKLANNAVTTDKVVDSGITTAKLANNAVTTPKINDGAVTAPKLDAGTSTDVARIGVADENGDVTYQNINDITPKFFYMPAVVFDTSTAGTDLTRNLYEDYSNQFTGQQFDVAHGAAGSSMTYTGGLIGSTGAPAMNVFAKEDLHYYISYYDESVFANLSIDADGVLTYDIIGTATSSSYMNIIFVIK